MVHMSDQGPLPVLTTYVDQVLDEPTVVADRSWGHGETSVLELRDRHGRSWYAKQHRDPQRYANELTAYVRWVPALGGRAPTLLAHHDELGVLILSAVRGTPGLPRSLDPQLHQQAGVLLRRLHDGEALAPWRDFAADRLRELERWASRSDGLVSSRHLDFARAQVRDLVSVGAPARVPCHLDYSPRNWLIDEDRLHVIDFEWASGEVWVNDLARLYFGPWQGRPDLQEAFLDGYGRAIGDEDRAVLLACGALSAVRFIVWAHAHGDVAFEQAARANLAGLAEAKAVD